MKTRNFKEMLEARWAGEYSVCVGLDSDYKQIKEVVKSDGVEGFLLSFNRPIIEATRDLVCAYKLNIAFYEVYGGSGWRALQSTIGYINYAAPEVPVILDFKRADIGSTNLGYVQEAFDYFRADAVTVHPYLGAEAMKPFLEQKDKGIFVLCRTSNPGARELQDLQVFLTEEECQELFYNLCTNGWTAEIPNDPILMPLYQVVAHRVANNWDEHRNCGLVVGATYPEELAQVRKIVSDMPILIPGIGAQGGDVEKTVKAGMDSRGWGMIINSSRGIIFASKGPDFAEAARRETKKIHDSINQYRMKGVTQ